MTETPVESIATDPENGLMQVFTVEAHNEKNLLDEKIQAKTEEIEFTGE